ncbi:hypothetical protein [Corynebacterium sp. A21]|uniref:hypothetical protein n=1 Tax=Corynebacterium sp. A21 TaxID=3457318 RepID=UPI003FCEF856
MRDAPPELIELTEFSEVYPVMVTEAESNRPDADALAWAKTATREEVFGSVTVPVWVVVREQTYPMMVTAAEWVAGSIPQAHWKRVPGAHHGWEPGPMAREAGEHSAT